ncbi:MAG TPA: CapA family protein [Thermodesulfobacteriota bacterium]|nr:CapA family protein [Thermodesulfobacteriota bacterium]
MTKTSPTRPITIFMCGDVMTGRGIDQVLPHPSHHLLYAPYLRSAREYVDLAEKINGSFNKRVEFSYIWGDALKEFERLSPDLKIINLETSITTNNDYWKRKWIHYRMHPKNVACLTAAEIDCCSLANNHVLDWGYQGLRDTLETLDKVDIKFTGAGLNRYKAETPIVMPVENKGRIILFAYGSVTSGIPPKWAASHNKPGVSLLKDFSDETINHIGEKVKELKKKGDVLVISIHWGRNWGYEVPSEQREFARRLIDEAGVDIIHGHSSHHPKGIEVYQGKLIIYGCGDFMNDYEGIVKHKEFRPDLTLMYFVSMDPSSGKLTGLRMSPMQIKHFKLNRVRREDAFWIAETMSREGKEFGTRTEVLEDNTLRLEWN